MTLRPGRQGIRPRGRRKLVAFVGAVALLAPILAWDTAIAAESFAERCDEMAWVPNGGEGDVAEVWVGSRDGDGSNLSAALGISGDASSISDWSADGRSANDISAGGRRRGRQPDQRVAGREWWRADLGGNRAVVACWGMDRRRRDGGR